MKKKLKECSCPQSGSQTTFGKFWPSFKCTQATLWEILIFKGAEVTKYSIERRCISTNSNWEEIGETNANTFNYCDTKNVVCKREYQYRVFAYNEKGKSLPGGPTPGFLAEKRTRKFFFSCLY